jgi:molybdopterin-binding aldehyde dehydrogenase-like protein
MGRIFLISNNALAGPIGHESWSGNLPGGRPETTVQQTRLLYAGEHQMTALRLAMLDLPEGNAMRAPGEAPGMMALEIAIDEMAERLNLDPVEGPVHADIPHQDVVFLDEADPMSSPMKQNDH